MASTLGRGMSNTICDNFCNSDKGLLLFKKVFGDGFIESFYRENTGNPAFHIATGEQSLVSIMASNISSAALFMVGLIFFTGVIKWILDSANDGEALGNKGSALGSVARPIFAIVMLMPTPSKFAVINIITLYFALWGHGFANKAYTELLVGTFDTGILQIAESDDMLSRASDLSGAVFSGALSGYCSAYVTTQYSAAMTKPDFVPSNIPVNPIQGSGSLPPSHSGLSAASTGAYVKDLEKPRKSFGQLFTGVNLPSVGLGGSIPVGKSATFEWAEADKAGGKIFNSAGPICGQVTFTLFQNPMPVSFGNASTNSPHWAARRLSFFTGELNAQMSAYKYAYAQEAYRDGISIISGSENASDYSSGLYQRLDKNDLKTWTTKLDLASVEADINDQAGAGQGNPSQPPEQANGGIQVGAGQQVPSPLNLISAANWHEIRLKNDLKKVLNANGFQLTDNNGTVAGTTLKCGGVGASNPNTPGSQPQGKYQETMCEFLSEIYAGGWLNAAPAREKIKQYKMSATQHILDPAYDYSYPGYLATNSQDDSQIKKANMFQTAMSTLRTAATESKAPAPALSSHSMVKTDGIGDIAFAGAANAKSGIMDKLTEAIKSPLFSLERAVIEFATGTGEDDGVDALTRMQDFGVGLNYVTTAYDSISFSFKSSLTTASFACSITPGLIKNFAYDCGDTVKSAKMGFDILWSDMLDSTMRMLSIVAAYFSVFIPTMPFVFLLMAAIGWFIQVFQTLVGMPLWAIMHSIPGSDFIGGQQHGYFALISLFFRPLIIVVGFFLAFELYDPIITLLVQGYFDMHQALIMSGSTNGLLAAFEMLSTWTLHLMVLANLVLAATYLVFGLIQELSDTTIEFMGTRVFAGFGNQETKSVAQGSAQTFGSADAASRLNKRQSKDRLAQSRQGSKVKDSDPSLASGDSGNSSATGGGGGQPPAPGDGGGDSGGGGGGAGGGGAGGGGARDVGSSSTGAGASATGGGGASYDIQRESGYTADTHSSMVPGVADSAVQSAVAKADRTDTFGRFGGKARAAGRDAQRSATNTALAGGSSRSEARAIGRQAGREAKESFNQQAQAGHDERMDALRSGNERGYNAMYQKHIQEGVPGVSASRQDQQSIAANDLQRYGGNTARAQTEFKELGGAIDQAVRDASSIPNGSERSAVGQE